MFSRILLKLMGWKVSGEFPRDKKLIVVVAPHTSMWDFVIGRLFFNVLGVKTNFIIKRELFFFPLGIILKSLGALPIDRGNRKNNMVDKSVEYFNNAERLILVITPEGTRKKTTHWKKGFYMISEKANVPMMLGIIHWGKKTLFVGPTFEKSGNMDEDLKRIRRHYKDAVGKHPDQFSVGDVD